MIHPFLDGNGRVGRLLRAFYLASKDILHKPTLYLSRYFKRNRESYYECLYNALIIYEGLFDKLTVSIEEVVLKLKTSYASATRLIDRLIEIGILSNLDNRKRKRVLVYQNYMDIFNKD